MELKIENHIDIPSVLLKVESPAFWKYAANEWWKLLIQYTPMETGTTSESVKITGEPKTGLIDYLSPQAHYLYRGELMVDPATGSSYAQRGAKKEYTGVDLNISKERHPLASKEWDKAAEPLQFPKLIRAMQGYIDSGRLKLNE